MLYVSLLVKSELVACMHASEILAIEQCMQDFTSTSQASRNGFYASWAEETFWGVFQAGLPQGCE